MNKKTKFLSLLTVCALSCTMFALPVSAENEESQKIRIIIRNETLSLEDGADWVNTLVDEWVPFDSDTTAESAFLKVLESHGYTQTGAENGYITEINGLSAEDGGSMGGWMMMLDDWITDEGISAYTASSGKLENGDILSFLYSCSWGADLGYDWSGSDTTLSDVKVVNGYVDGDLYDVDATYNIVVVESTDSIIVTPEVNNKAYRAKVYKNEYTPTQPGTDYKPGQKIEVKDGDKIYIGVANPSWMQSNYNNAEETVYSFNVLKSGTYNAVQKAIEMIDDIGTVTVDSKIPIFLARTYCDSLTEEKLAFVTNYDVLQEAERRFHEIMSLYNDGDVQEVCYLISWVKPFSKRTEGYVMEARKKYDALSDEKKELVNNYNDLVEAEEMLKSLSEAEDRDVLEAIYLIDSIGEVSRFSEYSIRSAREKYDSLSESQRSEVTNYGKLIACEGYFNSLYDKKSAIAAEAFIDSFYDVCGRELVFGNEWTVINAARFGIADDEIKNTYVESVKKALDENGSSKLSATRSTVNSGVVTALTSLGIDASDFYGYDLVSPLTDLEYVRKQGVNGSIYALIALDTNNYEVPDGIRESLIDDILSAQKSDGGWTIDTWSDKGDGSDADLTAMALQALAPYYKDKENVDPHIIVAADKAIYFLSEMFRYSYLKDGSGKFSSYGSYDSESSSQVILALCSLDIDPISDERFSGDGYNAYGSLFRYLVEDELKFSHYENGEANALSTTQAYSALSAAYRFYSNKNAYFDMTDVNVKKSAEESSQQSSEPDVSSRIPDPSNDNFKTGDSTSTAFAASLVMFSLAAGIFAFSKKREKN